MENEGNPSPTSPNIKGSQAGGEILQLEQTVPKPEFFVYARKNTQRKSKDQPTTMPQSQSESLEKGPSSSSGNPDLVPPSSVSTSSPFPSAVLPNVIPTYYDLPIAIMKVV